jgi:hypothetical protein
MIRIPNIKKRPEGLLARTNYVNEVADAVAGLVQPSDGGQSLDNPYPRLDKVLVKLTSAVNSSTSIGRYNGRMSDMVINLEATGNLVEADLGTFASADDTIVWLMGDVGQSSNSVSSFSPAPFVYGWLIDTNSSGKKIVIVPRGGGSSLPTPSAAYQVLLVQSYTSSSVYTLAFDSPRII